MSTALALANNGLGNKEIGDLLLKVTINYFFYFIRIYYTIRLFLTQITGPGWTKDFKNKAWSTKWRWNRSQGLTTEY